MESSCEIPTTSYNRTRTSSRYEETEATRTSSQFGPWPPWPHIDIAIIVIVRVVKYHLLPANWPARHTLIPNIHYGSDCFFFLQNCRHLDGALESPLCVISLTRPPPGAQYQGSKNLCSTPSSPKCYPQKNFSEGSPNKKGK